VHGTRRMLWLAAYTLVVLAPLAFVLLADAGDDLTLGIALAAGLGFAGFAILALQLVLPTRARAFTEPFGVDVLLRFHREVGMVAAVLVVAHVVVLMVDDPGRLALLNPFDAPWRAVAGVSAVVALVALIASSTLRRRLRLRYERWRALHLVLGALVVVLSLAHVLGVGRYLALETFRGTALALTVAAAFGLFALRIARPFAAAGRPYVLEGVHPERGDATTLQLRADGHDGLPFEPGQFAWLKLADAPYALTEHPFSLSSSAEHPERPAFTIKSLGDFTSEVRRLRRGARVLLDGPHGSFRPPLPDAGYVLVAGGIGITPAMSLVRTLADRGDQRPVTLVYASRDWDDATFRDELEGLPVEVVHVLSRPQNGWPGERGRVDASLLERVLPPDAAERNVLVCGPPAMAEAAREALIDVGVPPKHVHVERFESV
jgi:predicted ferric reductase